MSRRATALPIDVHLMVENPEQLLEPFANGRGQPPDRPRGNLPGRGQHS